ncbi:hypothetical protein BVX94_00440, partial [bacterium B17]
DLRDSGNLKNAKRLAGIVLQMNPHNISWRFETLRIMILDGDYQEVLDSLGQLAELPKPELRMERDVLEAYALTGLGRYGEAERVLELLPDELVENDPRTAMVMSEVGMYSNNPKLISRHIALASAMPENNRRIRRLFPYMRTHKMWKEISSVDRNLDYENILHALSAAEAYMNLKDVPSVARVALRGVRQWPRDPRFLTPVFFLTLESLSQEWEDLFAEHLKRCVGAVNDPEMLNSLFPLCFQLRRPDLVWIVFTRMSEIDHEHPSLWICVARFGHQWFRFRKHWLGLSSEEIGDEIDTRSLFVVGLAFRAWDLSLAAVPVGRKLCVEDVAPVQREYLDRALKEFRKRDELGTLTESMRHDYMKALGLRGDIPAAVRQFQKVDSNDEDSLLRSKLVLSEIYEH